jgi:GNAT superfamily N-acetyltransferase
MTEVVSLETNSQVRAEYLGAEELKLAASLLYQAYHDDPVFLEIFNAEKDDYEQRLRASIREELGAFWHAKQPMIGLYQDETLVGVACLNEPEAGVGSDRFWHWRLKMLLSAGYLSTKQLIEKEKIIMEAVPLKHYHMLSFIAVHPLHQHHGFGHYLMAAINSVLAEHKESEGIAVYASTGKYREFFNDGGYQFIKDVTVGHVTGALMLYYRESDA